MKYMYAVAFTAACLVATSAQSMSEVQNAITEGNLPALRRQIEALGGTLEGRGGTPEGRALIVRELDPWIRLAKTKEETEKRMLRDGGLGVSHPWGYGSGSLATVGGTWATCHYYPSEEHKKSGNAHAGKFTAGAAGVVVGLVILKATWDSNGAQQNAENRKANYTSICAYLKGLHTTYPAPRPGTASSLAASAQTLRETKTRIADITAQLAALEGR